MGSRMGFYFWQETEAGLNPGLPGKDELNYWWTHWWGHCLLHKDCLSYYQDPSLFGQALASSTTVPLFGAGQPKRNKERNHVMVERPRKDERLHKAMIPAFPEKCSTSYLIRLYFIVFWRVSSTNRNVGFWHQWICCQTVEHNTRSYLIVNSKNKSIVLLQLRLRTSFPRAAQLTTISCLRNIMLVHRLKPVIRVSQSLEPVVFREWTEENQMIP